MTDDRPPSQSSPSQPSSPDRRLDALGEELRRARARVDTDGDPAPSAAPAPTRATRTMAGAALRIGLELVTAMAVASWLGLWFDRSLGTAPWGLVAFFLLGAGAGFRNVYRAARQFQGGPIAVGRFGWWLRFRRGGAGQPARRPDRTGLETLVNGPAATDQWRPIRPVALPGQETAEDERPPREPINRL